MLSHLIYYCNRGFNIITPIVLLNIIFLKWHLSLYFTLSHIACVQVKSYDCSDNTPTNFTVSIYTSEKLSEHSQGSKLAWLGNIFTKSYKNFNIHRARIDSKTSALQVTKPPKAVKWLKTLFFWEKKNFSQMQGVVL